MISSKKKNIKECHENLENGEIGKIQKCTDERPKDGQCIKAYKDSNVRKLQIILLNENI